MMTCRSNGGKTMFKCKNCGLVFEELEIHYERHPYGEGYVSERIAVCPNCSDYDIEEYMEDEE